MLLATPMPFYSCRASRRWRLTAAGTATSASFRPFLTHFSALCHPTRLPCDLLLVAHACWMLIGACDSNVVTNSRRFRYVVQSKTFSDVAATLLLEIPRASMPKFLTTLHTRGLEMDLKPTGLSRGKLDDLLGLGDMEVWLPQRLSDRMTHPRLPRRNDLPIMWLAHRMSHPSHAACRSGLRGSGRRRFQTRVPVCHPRD